MDDDMKALACTLYDINAIAIEESILLSGKTRTSISYDLSPILEHPRIMAKVADILGKRLKEYTDVTHICGIPHTLSSLASLISVKSDIQMLTRIEIESNSWKEMIQGRFGSGDHCVIIGDTIGSGCYSIIETAKALREQDVTVRTAFAIVDNQCNGRRDLGANGIEMKTLFTMTEFIQCLIDTGRISETYGQYIIDYVVNQ